MPGPQPPDKSRSGWGHPWQQGVRPGNEDPRLEGGKSSAGWGRPSQQGVQPEDMDPRTQQLWASAQEEEVVQSNSGDSTTRPAGSQPGYRMEELSLLGASLMQKAKAALSLADPPNAQQLSKLMRSVEALASRKRDRRVCRR
jgi:hypothetical protein